MATKDYVTQTFALFQTFGEALGLFVKEIGIKEFLISDDPLPQELADLPFMWEIVENPSKVLGVFVGDKISPKNMGTYLQETLDKRLAITCKFPQTLKQRVQLANQFVASTMMYMLKVFLDKPSFL